MKIPPLLFFIFVVVYAVLAFVILTADELAKGWSGFAVYAIGCVLVFLAFSRKSKVPGRESHGTAGQAQDD